LHVITTIGKHLRANDGGPRVTSGDVKLAIRQFFRPHVLSLLALAIAVGGWGYGYKLSRYLDHPDVSKASATRMLPDHRDDGFRPLPQHKTRIDKPLDSQGFLASTPRLPQFYFSRDLVVAPAAPVRITLFVSPLSSFRAPPASKSLLA
jgi:hypothetical protein